jgi:hypothetical protein
MPANTAKRSASASKATAAPVIAKPKPPEKPSADPSPSSAAPTAKRLNFSQSAVLAVSLAGAAVATGLLP